MAKLKTPLLSFNARGTLAKILSFRLKGKQTIIEKKPILKDAKSFSQLSWRHMYQKATALWNALSTDEKKTWEANATPRHMTGYAWFMSQCLKPNPGIYLPLQGGTMSGNIDMADNRILDLPTPTANEEPTRKQDLADHNVAQARHGMTVAEYVAIAYGEQYVAVRRLSDTMLGRSFYRAVDNDYLYIHGGQTRGASISLYGKDHMFMKGFISVLVPNAAGSGTKNPILLEGRTNNP
ncbi:unnamed protein product, partial [marine sediment metagenome]